MTNKKRTWTNWFDGLDDVDQRAAALGAIERLIELEEVGYRKADDDEDEDVYWIESGESLVVPF